MASGELGFDWRLRQVMAERGIWKTTELTPLLRARGIALSASQVYRVVTNRPERVSLALLAALCDILDCSPADLIQVEGRTDRDPVVGKTASIAPGTRLPAAPGPQRPPAAAPLAPLRAGPELDDRRPVTVMQNASATPSDYGMEGAARLYILWPPDARRGTDANPDRSAIRGLIWQDPGERVWHGMLGEASRGDVGGPFRTLTEARAAVEEMAATKWGRAP